MKRQQRADRRYRISGVGVAINAPAEILRVLDVTLLHVPTHDDACQIRLTVTHTGAHWDIADEFGAMISLPSETASPEIAGALTTAMVERVARESTTALVTGVIISKDDFAVALVGDDWGSCIAIAMHLSLRGWSIVTPRYAFVDPETRAIEPFSKLLYIPSRIISLLPLPYRRTLEASPWYSTGDELGFYGVDPRRAQTAAQPAAEPILRATLIVDDSRRDPNGYVEEPAHAYIGTFLPISVIGIASASVVVGSIVPTTDAVERWIDTQSGIR